MRGSRRVPTRDGAGAEALDAGYSRSHPDLGVRCADRPSTARRAPSFPALVTTGPTARTTTTSNLTTGLGILPRTVRLGMAYDF